MTNPGQPAVEPHSTTVTMVEGSDWRATASCADCDWEGEGWVETLQPLADSHAAGTDGSR